VFILPIGDLPNPPGFRPWVTWLLIAANVLVYLLVTLPQSFAMLSLTDPAAHQYLEFVRTLVPAGTDLSRVGVSQWDLTVFEYGFRPAQPSLVDLFLSMFMHAGLAHLAGNMLFLWIYGDNVEHKLGRLRYLAAYLGTGIVATIAFAAWGAFASSVPLVGASGAISGVLGLYFVWYPRNVVRMFVVLLPFLINTIVLPAWVVLGAYVLFDNLVPLLFSESASGVAYGAHLGGFLGGALIAWGTSTRGIGLPRVGSRRDRRPKGEVIAAPGLFGGSDVRSAIADADVLVDQGRSRAALTLLARRHDRAGPGDRGQLALAIGQRLTRLGRVTEGFQWLVKALRDPGSRDQAARELRKLELPPQLLERLGL